MRQAQTVLRDEASAVRELSEQLDRRDAKIVLVFCSPTYDLERLGACISASFAGPVVGCTTSGQIGATGYQKGGIT
ncbi:MAG: FIST N-terminal domain-containing protein, partial [Polyangiaceae bacterium]